MLGRRSAALWMLTALLVSSLPSLPTATAQSPTPVPDAGFVAATANPTCVEPCRTVQDGPATRNISKINDWVNVTVWGWVDSTGCTLTNSAPSVTVTVDYTLLGGLAATSTPTPSVNATTNLGLPANTRWSYNGSFTFQLTSGTNRTVSLPDPVIRLPTSVTATCANGQPAPSNTVSSTVSTPLVVDNIPPAATFSVNLLTGNGGLGSTFSVTGPGSLPKDLDHVNLTFAQFNRTVGYVAIGGSPATIASTLSTQFSNLLVDDNGFANPKANATITDTSGNVWKASVVVPPNTFDLRRPRDFSSTPTMAASISPRLNISVPRPAASSEYGNLSVNLSDTTDTNAPLAYLVTCRYADAINPTIVATTPADGCKMWNATGSDPSATIYAELYPTASLPLKSDHKYRATVAFFDAKNNTNNWTQTNEIMTAAMPLGNVKITLPAGKTIAAIGDTITLQPDTSSLQDIFRISADVSAFSSEIAPFWQWTPGPPGGSWNYGTAQFAIVNATTLPAGSAITLPVTLTGNNSLSGFGSIVDTNGNPFTVFPIDPRAPGAPANVTARPLSNGRIEVAYSQPTDTDLSNIQLVFTDLTTSASPSFQSCTPLTGAIPTNGALNTTCIWNGPINDHLYGVQVRAIDTAGNNGPLFPSSASAVSAPSSANPVTVDVTVPASPVTAFPTFPVAWSLAGTSTARLAIGLQIANNSYWTGAPLSSSNAWTAPNVPYLFPLNNNANVTGTGTLTAANFSASGTNGTNAATLLNGSYRAVVFLNDTVHAVSINTPHAFTLDYGVSVAHTSAANAIYAGWPTFSGTWTGPLFTPNLDARTTSGNLSIALAFSNGTWWNLKAQSQNPYSSTPVLMRIWNNGTNTAGTWTATNFTVGPEASAVASLGAGTYTLMVQIIDVPHGEFQFANVTFTVDTSPASVGGLTAFNPSVPTPVMQSTTPMKVHVFATDTGTGLDRLTFKLVAPDGSAVNAIGSTTITCSAAGDSICALDTPITSANRFAYEGNASFTFTGILDGEYRLQVRAFDIAGNVPTAFTMGDAIFVTPRIAIQQDSSSTPTVDASNTLFVNVFAANDSLSGGACSSSTSTVCRVSKVDILVRTDSAAAGDTLATVVIPGTAQQLVANGPLLFDYSPGRLSIGTRDRNHTQVSALATYVAPDGSSKTVQTPWYAVTVADAVGSNLQVLSPISENAVMMPRADGSYNYTVAFVRDNLASRPFLKYWVNTSTASPIEGGADGTTAGATPIDDGTLSVGPTYLFNFSNKVSMASGKYTLTVIAYSNLTPAANTKTVRNFSVESMRPSISFTPGGGLTQPEVALGVYTKESFNFSAKITTGFARLSPSGLSVGVYGDRPTFHQLATGTFNASLLSLTETSSKDAYIAKWNVELPSDTQDGYHFDIQVTASTDSVSTAGSAATAVLPLTVFIDQVAPEASVDVLKSQATAVTFGSSDDIRIIGYSNDTGAGTSKIELNIYDEQNNRTYVWDAGTTGAWVAGHVDSWMSSEPVNIPDGSGGRIPGYKITNVLLAHSRVFGIERTTWSLSNSHRPINDTNNNFVLDGPIIGLDTGVPYTVKVRATDLLGHASEGLVHIPHLDTIAPAITSTLSFGTTGTIDGEGSYIVLADALDNACLARVVLHGVSPSGVNLSADMAPPSTAKCQDSRSQVKTWSLDLRTAPILRSAPGVWRYSVEAIDSAGNNVSSNGVSVWVRDDTPPVVANLTLEPSVTGAGSTSRITANIVEAGHVSGVTVRVFADNSSFPLKVGTLHASASSPPSSVNGSGLYEADLRADLNLDLAIGTYRFDVFADDNRTIGCDPCHQIANVTLSVVAEAPPDIRFDKPADTTLVAPNSTVIVRVTGKNLSASDLTVTVNGAALPSSALSVTFPGSGTTVMAVSFSTGALADGANYSVGVTLHPALGLAASKIVNFTVDAIPPSVTATPHGNVTVNGRDYVSRGATLSLTATDASGQVGPITYTLPGKPPATYSGPIPISGLDGSWTVDYTATDKAGNSAPVGHFGIFLDATGPTVNVPQAGGSINATVNDAGAGVDETSVKVFYALGTSVDFVSKPLARLTGTPIYTATIPGDTSAGFSYYVVAKDKLGNEGSFGTPAAPIVVNGDNTRPAINTAPTVKITRPANSDSVTGDLNVAYTADDIETPRSLLKVTLSLLGPDGNRQNLIADAPNSGSYRVTTTGFAAGSYTLALSVSDGEKLGQDTVTFTVVAAQAVEVRLAPAANGSVNDPIAFSVGLNPAGGKVVKQATWTAYKGDEVSATGVLQEGANGYAAAFTPTEPGTYTIKVQASYTDGSADSAGTTVGTVTVAGSAVTPTAGAPISFILLLVLAAATIALAAYGAFVRWKP